MTDKPTNDHDLLIKLGEQIKFVRDDIKDLKDGTSSKISDLYGKVKTLEDWKMAHCQENKDTARNNVNYMRAIIGVGVALLGFLIWHMTGYHI